MHTTVLNDDQILRIHQASLDMLQRVGVVVPHADMLERLDAAGAIVDHDAQRVRMGEELIASSLASAGKQFTLYGRDPARTASFGTGARNYNSTAGQASWLEAVGGERRFASLADVATGTRLGDALDPITIVGAMADPHELPVAARCVEVLATQLAHTTKPVTFWFHDRAAARYVVEMLIALRGGRAEATERPLCYPLLEPISPLRFPHDGIDLLYETARLNLPVHLGPMAQMGLSALCSLAGTMAQQNAEVLAALVITQQIRPGLPVCYGGLCHAFDMRTTQLIFAGPEQAVFGVAMTQMGKRYGLPVYVNVGLTDAKRPDAQAGLEAGVTLAAAAAAGADIFGHMGICGVDQGASLDMLILQDEIIAYVESALRPLDLSDEAIGLDVLDAVGPGGTFIETMHTAEHFRRELYFPRLLDRDYYQAWLDAGAPALADRCRERKEYLLATHEVEPLDGDLATTLDEIVAAAKAELVT